MNKRKRGRTQQPTTETKFQKEKNDNIRSVDRSDRKNDEPQQKEKDDDSVV